MADLIAQSIIVTCQATGGASRMQVFGGTAPNQFLVCDFELTGAQAQSLATCLATATVAAAATAAQTVTVNQAAQASPLPGIYNAL